jgi:hypothetical protein
MPNLFNNQTQRLEKVPEEAVTNGVFSGQYSFRKNTDVPVVTPDGRIATIKSEDFTPEYGYSYATKQHTDQKYKQDIQTGKTEAFGGTLNELAAGAAGAARAATFGLSDAAMTAGAEALGAGDTVREGLQTLKDVNPNATLAGEAAGTIASLATGMGAASLAEKAGVKATERLFTGAATKATDRIIRAGLGSAVEGALYSTGSVVSEAALGDPNLNMQNALTEIGLGAALGGGLGALGKGMGETVSSAWKALKDSTLPTATADMIGKAYTKVSAIAKGLDAETEKELQQVMATKAGREMIMSNPAKVEQEMFNQVQQILETGKNITAESMGLRDAARFTQLATPATKENAAIVTKPVFKMIDSMNNVANKIETSAKYSSKDAPRFREYIQDFKTELSKAKDLNSVHLAAENMRKTLDDKILKFGQEVPKGVAEDTAELFKGVRREIRSYLENQDIFGDFGRQYANVNKAYHEFKYNGKMLAKLFGEKVPSPSGYGMDTVISPTKVSAFVKNPLAQQNKNKNLNLDKMLASIENLEANTPNVSGQAMLSGSGNPKYAETTAAIRNAIEGLKNTRMSSILMNRIESQTGKSLIGAVVGGTLGGQYDLPGGALAGTALGYALTNPKTVLRHLTRLELLGQKGAQQSVGAVEKFLGKTVSTVAPVGKLAVRSAPQFGAAALNKLLGGDSDDLTDLRSRLDTLDIHAADDLVTAQNPLLESASPDHHMALVNKTKDALDFVKSKLQLDPSMQLIPGQVVKTSSMQHDLNAYIDGAFRPARLLEEMHKGVPDARVTEAVAVVYPEFYNQVKEMVLDGITTNPKKIPYKDKLKLAVFLRVPTTPAMGRLDLLQNAHSMAPMKEDGMGRLSLDTSAIGAAGDFTRG